MPTPFDSVLRVQRRAMDAIRLSLLVETARDTALAAERQALDTNMEREAAVAANDWQLGAHPWGQRQRVRRTGLELDRRGLDARLELLRQSAMAACGEMLATTNVAGTFTADARRREGAAEQAHADDLNGARRYRRAAMASAPR